MAPVTRLIRKMVIIRGVVLLGVVDACEEVLVREGFKPGQRIAVVSFCFWVRHGFLHTFLIGRAAPCFLSCSLTLMHPST